MVDGQDKMIHAECRLGKRNSSALRHSCCYVVRIHRPTQFDSGHNAGIEKKKRRGLVLGQACRLSKLMISLGWTEKNAR